ncbi:AMP-binding protein [Nocardia sp. NPDC059246]|uniref:AMP-binding protein n=1 Tax=unclassified Nocardia TaxID=2637762 RepID=UPI0036BCDEDB
MTTKGNILRFLQQHLQDQPNGIAFKFEHRNYTYTEVDEETEQLAGAFRDIGVSQGDTVCLMLPNCPELIFSWWALARLGAVAVPINVEYTEERLARLINTAKARVVLVDSRFERALTAAVSRGSDVHTVIHRGPRSDADAGARRTVSFDDFKPVLPDPVPVADVQPHDPFMLLFTSGSTGEAKAVEISHGYAEHFATEKVRHFGHRSDDVLFTCYPLFHAEATLETVMPALILGATAAVVERFSASRFWDQIRELEATTFWATGTVQGILLSKPASPRDREHNLRFTYAGAVHDRVKEFEDRFGVHHIQYYGSTECGLVAFHVDGPAEPGIMGRPCEHHDVVIADENDEPVPAGTVGQILVRPRVAHGCMTGYYGDGNETAKAWRNLWHHTGDLAYVDETGLLRFAGRLKDVIRRRGRNIPPVEIETVLRKHPDVNDCAAIAVPAELAEDDIKVVVEPHPGSTPDVDAIIEMARESLPRHMQPRYFELVSEIPRTPTKKPDKPALRRNWRTPGTIDLDNTAVVGNSMRTATNNPAGVSTTAGIAEV